MKVDRKTKAEKSPPAAKTVKKARRAAPKINGKHPLTAYEHIPIGIVEASPEGNYVDVNEEFCRILGYSREELLQLGIKDCTHEDDYGIDSKLYERLIADKIPFYRLEKRFVRKSGESIWVELTRTLVCDEKGKPLYTVGVVLDISDRKGVEKVLRESVERLRLATETARMFMWEWDFQNDSYILADNFEQVLGFSANLLPKNSVETLGNLIPVEDVQAISEAFENAVKYQRDLHTIACRVINPETGQMIWLEISAKIVYDTEGRPERMFGVAQNITESKKVQDEIAIISRVPEENPNPVMRLTPDGSVLYANGPSRAMLESWKQQGGRTIPEGLQKSIEEVFASGIKKELEITQNGRTFSCTLAPIHEAGYINFYANDITGRKQAEEALTEFARQQEALYNLSEQLHRTDSLEGVYNAALDAILSALQCDRASILLYDNQDVMRFVAWRGLSDTYRSATDGHSPWTPDAKDPQPISMEDIRTAELEEWLRTIIQGEGIGALAFIPLVVNEQLIGKFMIYYDTPHTFDEAELDLSLTIARQLAFGVDRNRTVQALKRERETLERLFETMPVMVSMIEPETNSMRMNAEFERVLGWSSDDVTVLSLLEALYPDVAYRNEVLQRMAAAAGKNEWVEVRVQARDGRTLDSMWSNISIMEGEKLVMGIALGLDITERKSMEEKLRVREAELDEVINQTPFMLTRCTRDLRYRFVSRAYAEMIGRKPEDLEGKPIVEIMGEEGLRTISPYIDRVLAGERVEYETEVSFQDVGAPFLHVVYTPDQDEQGNVIGWFASIVDISERKRIEAALRIENERFMRFVDSNIVGILIGNVNGEIILANDYYLRLLGVSRQDFVEGNVDWKKFTPPEWLPADEKAIQELRERGVCEPYEKEYLRTDGTRVPVYIADAMLPGRGQEIAAFVIDMSERKRAEEALRASEERYRGIVNQTIGGIAETDLTGQFTMVNDRYCEITGQTRQKLLNAMRIQDITHPDDLQENLELFGRLAADGTSFELEKRYVRPDGSIVWVHNSVSAITNADGKPQSAVAAVIDVTQRKRAEEALRRNEQMFSTLVDAAPFGVYFIDSEFRLRAINKGSEAVFSGIDPLIGRDFAEILRLVWQEPFASEAIERFRHTLQTGESFISPPVVEPRANIDDIEAYDWQIHRITLSDGTYGVVCYFYDLSEQKKMEATVRASESLYRAIARNIPGGGVYVVDKNFRYLVAEGPVTEAFGLTREMLEGRTVTEVFPDERGERMEERLRKNFAGETVSFETRFNERVFWTQQAPLLDSLGQAIILTLDITERKQAEEALRQSEERFARFMYHLPGLAWIKDIEGRYIYANAAAEQAFNTPRGQLYGKTDEDIFPPEIAAQFKRNDERALTDEKGVQVIETLKHTDGILHHSLVSKFPISGPDGKTTLIGGTAFDITERLRAEEALRESEERFRAILRQATAGIVRKDAEGRLIFVNQAFCNMLGYTESELLGKTIWDFIHEDDIADNKRLYERLMLEGVPFKQERRLLREDGSVIWVDASVSPIMNAEGKPQSVVAVEVDITGRKQAEEALQQLNLQLEDRVLSRTAKLRDVNQTLREEITERKRVEDALRKSEAAARENEEKLSTLFDLLPVGISFLDPQGQIIQMNSALANILKLSKEQFSGQAYKSRTYIRANGTLMLPTEFASRRALEEGKTIYNVETGVVLDDSEVIWTSVSAAPVAVADVGAVVVTTDITESKRAERALQESRERLQILSQRLVEVQEDERRAIARELHDRVGQTLAALNINLIIISGQLGDKVDEQISTRLSDSMKLVAETISLVRDVMSNLRPSVLDDYGLEAAIESHLSQFMSRYEINVKFEKPDQPIQRLGPSIEMTFLRIAQESLMNIARHAQATQINLSLRPDDQVICMTIQDNGIGIKSWQDVNRPGSHGLTIMRERAEAFGGSLSVSSVPGQGTRVEVRIPVENSNPPQTEREMHS